MKVCKTDQKIDLWDFRGDVENELAQFTHYWFALHRQDPEKYPTVMDSPKWWEHFSDFLATLKD
jgi:hypothetical protein